MAWILYGIPAIIVVGIISVIIFVIKMFHYEVIYTKNYYYDEEQIKKLISEYQDSDSFQKFEVIGLENPYVEVSRRLTRNHKKENRLIEEKIISVIFFDKKK